MKTQIQKTTLQAISRFLKILADMDDISVAEMNEINLNLKHLREKGTLRPAVPNKLIDRKELCSLLSISLSNLKRLEKTGDINIPIVRIGSTLRYRLHDVYNFIEGKEIED